MGQEVGIGNLPLCLPVCQRNTPCLHRVSILQVAGQSRMSLENLRGKDMQQFKRDRRGEVHVDEEAEGRAGT